MKELQRPAAIGIIHADYSPGTDMKASLLPHLPFRRLGWHITQSALSAVGPALFDLLGIVRVYTKVPGHPPDLARPFTLRGGGSVRDVAQQVHRGLADELRFARIWGPSAGFDGQQVSAEHAVKDRDVVELHF